MEWRYLTLVRAVFPPQWRHADDTFIRKIEVLIGGYAPTTTGGVRTRELGGMTLASATNVEGRDRRLWARGFWLLSLR
jgi:hypothetical protein